MRIIHKHSLAKQSNMITDTEIIQMARYSTGYHTPNLKTVLKALIWHFVWQKCSSYSGDTVTVYLTANHLIMYCLSLCIVVYDAWTEVAWFQQLQDQSHDIFS